MRKLFLFLIVGLLGVLLSILLAATVSATILLSNINQNYNLGDVIKLEAKISRNEYTQGFFRLGLFCNGTENLMYFSPIEIAAGKEKAINIDFPVKMIGNCYVSAILQDNSNNNIEETKSNAMVLSNKINVALSLNQKEFEPKDKLQVSGTAVKANGQNVQGIATLTFDKDYNAQVSGGKFSFNIELPANVAPGSKQVTVTIKDDNNNSGSASETVKILAVPTKINIEINNESFLPDSLLMITPKLLDQADNVLNATISVRFSRQISLLKTEKLLEELIQSGNSTVYRFTKFSQPGNYTLEASTQNFNVKKTVIVERYENINASLQDGILYISNIGNVPFKRDIEIEFFIENQSTKKIIPLDLKINENATFKLEAPKGTYNIKINTGSETFEFSGIPLTGYVVATIELNPKSKFDIRWLISLIALVAVLIILTLLLKTRKSHKEKREIIKLMKKSNATIVPQGSKIKSALDSTKEDYFLPDDAFVKKIFVKQAAAQLAAHNVASAIVYGTKQEITVLFVHLGLNSLNEIKKKDAMTYAKILDEYFKEIIQKIKEHQGVADLHGNNLIILFNVIKQYRHDVAALKTAEAIKKVTAELNQVLAPKGIKIEMRAGINTGFANLSSIQNGTVKYTAIGDTTSMAKILQAKAFDNEILFTEKIYDRVANIIKAKKLQPYYLNDNTAINIYALEDSTKAELRDKNQWYIKRALGEV